MLRNYLLISLRYIFRQKGNSLINLTGLALGITVSLFIVLYIQSEINFDSDYSQYKNIYRLASGAWAKSSPPAAEAISDYFPEIEEAGRLALFRGGTNIVVIEGIHFPINNGYYADPSTIKIFNREILAGNQDDLLVRPFTIVLSESLSETLFNDINPVGESIIFAFGDLQNAQEYEITGIIEDFPKNSHLQMEYLVSMSTFYEHYPEGWAQSRTWKVMYTYLLFKDEKTFSYVKSNLVEFQYDHQVNANYTKENLDDYGDYFELHPITDIHLRSHREQEMGPNSHIRYIYIFGALAVLIIVVASTNFINIFVTQALKRSKEVGIRKVTGAYRLQLVQQFLLEAFLYTLISTIIAILICIIALPVFNEIAGQNFSYNDLAQKEHFLAILILVFVVTILSGGYPAVYISGINAIDSIKINQIPRSSLSNSRRVLIILQFIIAIFMISSTLVISDQLQYLRNKDLGFDKEHVLSLNTYGDFNNAFQEKRNFIYQEIKRHPGIIEAGATSALIGSISSVEFLLPDGVDYTFERDAFMRFFRSDEGFIPTMGIELIEGRNFNPVSDSTGAFIVNEKVVEMLGLENPVGTPARNTAIGTRGNIVGVMKDFNFASLHNEIEPLVLTYRPEWAGALVVKLSGDQIQESIAHIESIVKEVAPGSIFTYSFLDHELNSLYLSEDKMSKIFKVFSFLAILISCMGLYGLAAYSAELRTKEIGIRKAFGASIPKILILLSKVYITLIFIAFIIAIPISNYFVTEWLKNFAYQSSVHWWTFVISGFIVGLIALMAVTGKSIQAARANPSKSLRSE
jgi:putative ABC transport system permease protein